MKSSGLPIATGKPLERPEEIFREKGLAIVRGIGILMGTMNGSISIRLLHTGRPGLGTLLLRR